MRRKLLAALVLGALTAAPAIAKAAEGFATANVNMRSGPSTAYPAVTMIPVGSPLNINGCLADVPWCDVSFFGGRGWVAGQYIQAVYQQRRIYVGPQYYRPLGIPTVVFNLDNYWDRYYRGRDFYRDRDRWRRGPGWDRRPGWDGGPDGNWDRRPDRRDWSDQGNDNSDWGRQRPDRRDWGNQNNDNGNWDGPRPGRRNWNDQGSNNPGNNPDWGQRPDRRRDDNNRNDAQRHPAPQPGDNNRPQRNANPGSGNLGPYSPDQVDPVPCNPGETCLRPSSRGSNR